MAKLVETAAAPARRIHPLQLEAPSMDAMWACCCVAYPLVHGVQVGLGERRKYI
jgi:hypothetical protein